VPAATRGGAPPADIYAIFERIIVVANAYFSKGDYDRALTDYDQVIQLDPRLALPYTNRGNVYVNKGDYDGALIDYNQAIQLDPLSGIIWGSSRSSRCGRRRRTPTRKGERAAFV
jgi:tetratricopeptide (TPR) repeat protein